MARWGGRRIALIPYSTGSIRIFQIVPTTNISMEGVKNEIDNEDYTEEDNYDNISLQELSDGTAGAINQTNSADDRPDGVAPHALSEFANYDHDKTGVGHLVIFPTLPIQLKEFPLPMMRVRTQHGLKYIC